MEQKDKDFSKLYHEIVDSGLLSQLSDAAIRVYWVIRRYADYTTLLSYPTVKTISKLSGVNKNLICSATKELVRFGLIKKFQVGKKFNFRNGYRIIEHPKVRLNIIPQKKYKCRKILRGKDGKFQPIPKNRDGSIPQNTDTPIPHITESNVCPRRKDKKEILETNFRDNVLEKDKDRLAAGGSQTAFGCKKKSIQKISADIINGLIKDKGFEWTQKYLRQQGYPEEEIQSLK